MSVVKTTLNVDSVNYEEIFTCAIDVSLNSLDEEISSAYIKLFIPDFIEFSTSAVQKPIREIKQEKTTDGTNVIFDFGTNIDEGVATQIEITGQFKLETAPNEIYMPNPELYTNDTFSTRAINQSIVTLKIEPNFQLSRKIVLPEINPAAGGEVYFCVSLENLGDLGAELKNIVIRIPASTLSEGFKIDETYTPAGFDESSSTFKDISQDGNIATITNTELIFKLSSYKGQKYNFFYKIILSKNLVEGEQIPSVAYWICDERHEEDMEVNSFTISEPVYNAEISSYGPLYTIKNELFNYAHNVTNTGNQILYDVYIKAELDDAINYTNITTGTFQLMGIKELLEAEYYIDFTTTNELSGRLGPFSTKVNEKVDLSKVISSNDNLSTLTWDLAALGVGVETKASFEINGVVKDNIELNSRILNHFEINWSENGEDQVKSKNVITEVDNLCVLAPIASRLTKYKVIPGETIRYKIGANCFWSRLKNPILAMFLPNQLTYVGDEVFTYSDYFTETPEGVANPKIEVLENFNNTDQTLVKFIYDYDFNQRAAFDIEFSAKVDIGAIGEIETQLMLNSRDNIGEVGEFDDIFEGNLAEPSINTPYVLSNFVSNNIELFASVNFDTKIKGEFDKEFIDEFEIAKTPEAGNVEYITRISNIGNANFTSIEIVDILPYVGDKGVVQINTPRGSEFAVYTVNDVVVDNSTVMYSETLNPHRFGDNLQLIGKDNNWQTKLPTEATNVKAFKISSNTILKPNETIEFKIYATTPSGVPLNSIAYNSFAAKMEYEDEEGNKQFLLPVEPPKTGVQIVQSEEGTIRLSGRIWLATAENEKYDINKTGINDVGIVLFNENGNVFATYFTTDNFDGQTGVYTFSNVPIGKYKMKIYIDTSDYVILAQDTVNQNGVTPSLDATEDLEINIALKVRKKIDSVLTANANARGMIRNVLYSQILTQMKMENIMEMI
ncbi:hypothetical protein AN640_01635 [Candidatus Epulonipiscium fishelsonii]|uniref:Uncharacterized protein n=1 Tax=Candidatus Epulonipiscium fishelsonii TaxID=77094 RepID=A0ACC8XBT6_9FIRM|nr:hypothetical protein AN640_01635 [Epulopiscium sp. SCG-D08WGA-EpuloA1]